MLSSTFFDLPHSYDIHSVFNIFYSSIVLLDTDDDTQCPNPAENTLHQIAKRSYQIEETDKCQLSTRQESDTAKTVAEKCPMTLVKDSVVSSDECRHPSTTMKDSVLSSDEDSDDLFLSPLSPTPPSSLADERGTKTTDLPEDVQKALELLNRAMDSVAGHTQSKIQKEIQKVLHSPSTSKISSKPKSPSTFKDKSIQGKISKTKQNSRVFIASGLTIPQVVRLSQIMYNFNYYYLTCMCQRFTT